VVRAHEVIAFNHAAEHENKVHDPEFARAAGFRGGIVPGVDVFAYMTRPVVEEWGVDWLRRGGFEVRFTRPVYDADRLWVEAEARDDGRRLVTVTNEVEGICATGIAEETAAAAPDVAAFPIAALPERRLQATPEAISTRALFGSIEMEIGDAEAQRQLEEVREELPVYVRERVAHPGHLLRAADAIIAANIELPPWMHVGSRVRFFDLVRWGDRISVRARLIDLFEKKGHRFIRLDVLLVRGDRPVMRVDPYTAIYRPAFLDRVAV
jgi:acyl dehydratase